MGNSLITLGVILLVVIVGAHIGQMALPGLPYLDELCKIQQTQWLLYGAGASFAAALLLRILAPVKNLAPKNRCRKCDNPIPRKDAYCAKCLREMKYKTQNRS